MSKTAEKGVNSSVKWTDAESRVYSLPDEPEIAKRLSIFYEVFSTNPTELAKQKGRPSRQTLYNLAKPDWPCYKDTKDSLFAAARKMLLSELGEELARKAALWLKDGKSPRPPDEPSAETKKGSAIPEELPNRSQAQSSTEDVALLVNESRTLLEACPRILAMLCKEDCCYSGQLPVDPNLAPRLVALEHVLRVLAPAAEDIRWTAEEFYPLFLCWLLERAAHLLSLAREDREQAIRWLQDAESCSQKIVLIRESVEKAVGTNPFSNYSLWKAAQELGVLRERLNLAAELIGNFPTRLDLAIQEASQVANSWAKSYEAELDRHKLALFDESWTLSGEEFTGTIADGFTQKRRDGIRVLLNREDLSDWVNQLDNCWTLSSSGSDEEGNVVDPPMKHVIRVYLGKDRNTGKHRYHREEFQGSKCQAKQRFAELREHFRGVEQK